jgi:hypothetical protein
MVQGSEPKDKKPAAKVSTPAGVFIRDMPEGTKLKLTDGSIVEITANARNGGYVLARYLEHPEEPELVGTEEWVFFGDVKEELD